MNIDNKRFVDLTWIDVKPHIKSLIIEIASESKNQVSDGKDILTISEASELLNLSIPTIYTYTHKKLIPFYKTGKKLMFKTSDLVIWINAHKKMTLKEIDQETLLLNPKFNI